MIRYIVITKDGSKWLRPVRDCVEAQDYIDEMIDNAFGVADILYLGSRPEGTVLDESEVQLKRQCQDVDTGQWFDIKDEAPGLVKDLVRVYREAYTDAESHDLYVFDEILNNTSDDAKMNVSLQMDLNYWKLRCEAAEKLIGISPSDPKTYDEFCRLREEWQSIVKEEPK